MRDYNIAYNNIYRKGYIILREGPWWAFLLEYFHDYTCHYLHYIPLPDIGMALNKEDAAFNGGEDLTTWKEWWGTLGGLFHDKFCIAHFNSDDIKEYQLKPGMTIGEIESLVKLEKTEAEWQELLDQREEFLAEKDS